MKNVVYKSYKNIENFLKKNHLLEGQIELNEGDNTSSIFIPICNISVGKIGKEMLIHFDTLDVNTGEISDLDYDTFRTYMHGLRLSGKASYQRHQVGPIGNTPSIVDYVTGSFKLPIKMIKSSFKLDKKQFYLVKMLSPNEHSILLLCSPDTDSAWLNKIGNTKYKLNKQNVRNLLKLLHYHLFNLPQGIQVTNSNLNLTQTIHLNHFNYKQDTITLLTDLGSIKFNIKNTTAYLWTPAKSRPRLLFEYHNSSKHNLTISVLLASKYKMNLIDKLTH